MKGCADTCMLIGLGKVMSWVKDYKQEKMVAPKFNSIGEKIKWVNEQKRIQQTVDNFRSDCRMAGEKRSNKRG